MLNRTLRSGLFSRKKILLLFLFTGFSFLGVKNHSIKFSNKDITPEYLQLDRVTTIAPFPRGLTMVDGDLYVLCRGRVRGAGGVSPEVEDQAGAIYKVDPDITEPFSKGYPSQKIQENGEALTFPTSPPFKLWNRTASPPENDRFTDRPYCTLRYHDPTRSFYLCAFSGVDKPKMPGKPNFSKNLTDALLRYDLRTNKWYEVERHDHYAGGSYPHHDPDVLPPPHGWLNGPDNCVVAGNYLYAVAKDNSRLIKYDLTPLVNDPEAGYPQSSFVLGETIYTGNQGMIRFQGHSTLAVFDNYLYVGSRTSSLIIRVPIDEHGLVKQPVEAELVARFQPYDPKTMTSADITDMSFDSKGRLYVVSAKPSRIFRFKPDPHHIYDASDPEKTPAWADLAAMTENPHLKSENVFVDDHERLFVTSGDGYNYQKGAFGTVYRIVIKD